MCGAKPATSATIVAHARQRSNEDTNRFLRQYFPDNTTLNAYTVERPLAVEYKINQPTLACRW